MALQLAAETRAKTGLVEDYFFVNDAALAITVDTGFSLVEPFCIQGPGVIDFNLAASFSITDANLMASLMIDGISVAQSELQDNESPSNLSLSYRGKIDEDVDAMLVIMAADETTIASKHLQYGYKLYGSEYNFIETTDMSCIL